MPKKKDNYLSEKELDKDRELLDNQERERQKQALSCYDRMLDEENRTKEEDESLILIKKLKKIRANEKKILAKILKSKK